MLYQSEATVALLYPLRRGLATRRLRGGTPRSGQPAPSGGPRRRRCRAGEIRFPVTVGTVQGGIAMRYKLPILVGALVLALTATASFCGRRALRQASDDIRSSDMR